MKPITILRVFSTAFFARSTALGAQTTGTDSNSSSAESALQPAGYNATRRALLLTVCCFYRTLGFVIEDRAGACAHCLHCVR